MIQSRICDRAFGCLPKIHPFERRAWDEFGVAKADSDRSCCTMTQPRSTPRASVHAGTVLV